MNINHLQIISPYFTYIYTKSTLYTKNSPRKSDDLQGDKMILHKTFTNP